MPESPPGYAFHSPPESPPPAKGGVTIRDEFKLLWPLIPGAVFTLIGVCFLLRDNNKAHGLIVCYVGLMALIVAAGKIWKQCIPGQYQQHAPEQSDPNAARRVEQSVNVILMACCFLGIVITG